MNPLLDHSVFMSMTGLSLKRFFIVTVLLISVAFIVWRYPFPSSALPLPPSPPSPSRLPPLLPRAPPPPSRQPLNCRPGAPPPLGPVPTDLIGNIERGRWIAPPIDVFNPLQGYPIVAHHPSILAFHQFVGPIQREYMTDWLGILTPYAHECSPEQGYNYVDHVPSRRYQCQRHCLAWNAGLEEVAGEHILVDDEYEEWVELLSSVLRTEDDYVIFELGARYATWCVRGLSAWRQLRGNTKRARCLALEPDNNYFAVMEHHVELNGFQNQSVLIKGKAGGPDGYTLSELMERAGVDHISLVDLDIQGSEFDFLLDPATMPLLNKAVAHVHLGTHREDHSILTNMFLREGWVKTVDFKRGTNSDCEPVFKDNRLNIKPQCVTKTRYGEIYYRDGMLGFVNPKLVDLTKYPIVPV